MQGSYSDDTTCLSLPLVRRCGLRCETCDWDLCIKCASARAERHGWPAAKGTAAAAVAVEAEKRRAVTAAVTASARSAHVPRQNLTKGGTEAVERGDARRRDANRAQGRGETRSLGEASRERGREEARSWVKRVKRVKREETHGEMREARREPARTGWGMKSSAQASEVGRRRGTSDGCRDDVSHTTPATHEHRRGHGHLDASGRADERRRGKDRAEVVGKERSGGKKMRDEEREKRGEEKERRSNGRGEPLRECGACGRVFVTTYLGKRARCGMC
eukprot:SAG11_NODE_281_length_11257_cov_45.949633_9_plen_276_part_00